MLTVNIIFIVVFGRKLFAIGDKDLGAQKQCKGRCYCEHGGPGGECDSEYFSDAALAQHTQHANGAFEAYLAVRRKLDATEMEKKGEEELVRRLAAELERRAQMSERELAVDDARKHIINEILTLKCPRCCTAFLDFANCFAVKCGTCDCHFCGWCIADCGEYGECHMHVAVCDAKPAGAGMFYADGDPDVAEDMFAKQNRARFEEQLQKFFAEEVEEEILQDVLYSIVQDLFEIGLGDFITDQLDALDVAALRAVVEDDAAGAGAKKKK